jgi:hypothetical protein
MTQKQLNILTVIGEVVGFFVGVGVVIAMKLYDLKKRKE